MSADLLYIRAAMCSTAWAILPARLDVIAGVIERRAAGFRLLNEEAASLRGPREPNGTLCYHNGDGTLMNFAAFAAARGSPGGSGGGFAIGVINIAGIIAQRAAQVDDISGPGGTSTERVGAAFRAALADPAISAIVLNVDSPGGNVFGVQELTELIRGSRGQKPVVAQVNSTAASAAYWIASAADEIVVTPSGQVGSIGVVGVHEDVSAAAEKKGVKFTYISAGKYKTEGNPFEPLGDEAMAAKQAMVDGYYGDFVGAVSKGRGVPVAEIRDGFGQGRMVRAQDAVKAGMADRVATLDATLRRLGAARPAPAPRAVEDGSSLEAANTSGTPPVGDTGPGQPRSEAPPKAPAAGLDAFRRRRHAHRMRSA